MGKRTRRFGVLCALAMASGFFFGTAAARAQSIILSNATGAAPSSVTINAKLSAGGKSVAATTNDIGFDSSTPIATSTQGHCAIHTATQCSAGTPCTDTLPATLPSSCSNDSTKACLQNSDCTSPGTCPRNEPCVNENAPDCQVNAAIGKSAFFGFLPNYCSNSATTACTADSDCTSPGTCTVACTPGTNCTGVRALIFGLTTDSEVSAITDGATLYSCTVNIAAGTTGSHTLTVSNESVADTTRALVCPTGDPVQPCPAGTNGTVTVGGGTPYWVCDVAPATGDDVGMFGNNSLNIADVKAIFKASLDPTHFAPAAGTARFSAMDAAPADNPTTCGGNTSLNIADVKLCFKRSLSSSEANYLRTGTGASCTSQLKP
jgi:hypothetical protein